MSKCMSVNTCVMKNITSCRYLHRKRRDDRSITSGVSLVSFVVLFYVLVPTGIRLVAIAKVALISWDFGNP